METKLFFLAFVFVVHGTLGWKYPEDVRSASEIFRAWKHEHKKVYRNGELEMKRFGTFLENLKVINQLNAEYRPGTKYAINEFADISPEEFRATRMMPKRRAPTFPKHRYLDLKARKTLPESFDWTTQGKVTAVKDQGDAGSCWAFSAIGNIEGQWVLQGKTLTNFSVEQVVECDGMEDVKGGHADCGVFGGWPYLAYQYVMKAGGLETWDDYWYCSGLGGAPGTCDPCPAPGYNTTLCGPAVSYCNMTQSCVNKLNKAKFIPGFKIKDWKAISQNETDIAQQLTQVGPLSIGLNANLLQFYHSGIFDPIICSPEDINHGVLLVGFGKEKELFKEKEYWKVKNSWGQKWGEHGYFRMRRGAGKCGVNTLVSTAILENGFHF